MDQYNNYGNGNQGGYGYGVPQGNPGYGYSPAPDYSKPRKQAAPISRFEIIVILLSLIALASVFTWGYLTQERSNRDMQREVHISRVITALDSFYENSSQIRSQRRYPVSICGSSLNSYDFEYTLRRHLQGEIVSLDTHNYIAGAEFPSDPWGLYSETLGDREVDFSCINILDQNSTTIYGEGLESCNFSVTDGRERLKQCYLYSSDTTGEAYQIGYYSEVLGQIQIYEKVRDGNLVDKNAPAPTTVPTPET